MIYPLEQHIFTTGGLAFRTVAASPGISRETRAELEARARYYDRGAEKEPPPLVFRSFPLSSTGTFAVSLLMDTGAAFSRARGNYLAHSYVIPHALLDEVGANLAWIAAYLPIRTDYQPRSGVESLEPLPCEVDAASQFRLVAFLVRDLGPTGVHQLLGALLEHLANPQAQGPLVVEMPPPPENLEMLIHETLRGPEGHAPPPPPPDCLRLWRLTAALAFFPTVFRQTASFTINETQVRRQDTLGSTCALFVLRTPQAEVLASAPGQGRQWIDHCIALVSQGHREELERLQAWLSQLLRTPSSAALNGGVAFYQTLVNPLHGLGGPLPYTAVVACINVFRASPGVNLALLYEAAQA